MFLGGDGPAVPHLVGFSQGVYRVATRPGGERFVRPGVPAPAGESAVSLARGTGGTRTVPLQAFEEQVRLLVREQGARR